MNTTAINFNNVTYTEASLNELSGPALVELYNEVIGTFRNGESVQNVRRFADKKSAVSRTWKMLQRYAEANPEVEAEPVKAEPQKVETVNETITPAPKAAKAPAEKKARSPAAPTWSPRATPRSPAARARSRPCSWTCCPARTVRPWLN